MRPFLPGMTSSALSSRRLRCPLLGAHALHRFLHLGRRDIANKRGDRPAMAERILNLAVAIAPEHVGHGHRSLGARPDGTRADRIDIVDIEMDRHRRALERLGAPCSGISSTSITVESPMWMLACMSRPFGPGSRDVSVA